MISVCIATYNGSKYIKEQLDSILCQIAKNDEVIISDDGSTDNTVEIIASLNDPRISLLRFNRDKTGLLPVNLVTTNFENALSHASGDIIFMADQDDVWHKDKVKVCLDYLINQGYDYVVSDCFVTDSDLNIVSDTRFDGSFTQNRWKALVSPTPYQGCCAAFKHKVLEKALPFPKHIQSHDRWIGYIASFKFNYKIIPEKLIYYRRHNKNVSTTTQRSKANTLYKIRTRVRYILELIKRGAFL